ncbi:uncharacterized protein LOC144859140 [Branchiostoma floridae x Branchiostoma japonicum]
MKFHYSFDSESSWRKVKTGKWLMQRLPKTRRKAHPYKRHSPADKSQVLDLPVTTPWQGNNPAPSSPSTSANQDHIGVVAEMNAILSAFTNRLSSNQMDVDMDAEEYNSHSVSGRESGGSSMTGYSLNSSRSEDLDLMDADDFENNPSTSNPSTSANQDHIGVAFTNGFSSNQGRKGIFVWLLNSELLEDTVSWLSRFLQGRGSDPVMTSPLSCRRRGDAHVQMPATLPMALLSALPAALPATPPAAPLSALPAAPPATPPAALLSALPAALPATPPAAPLSALPAAPPAALPATPPAAPLSALPAAPPAALPATPPAAPLSAPLSAPPEALPATPPAAPLSAPPAAPPATTNQKAQQEGC